MISLNTTNTSKRSISQTKLNNELTIIQELIKDNYLESRLPKDRLYGGTGERWRDLQKLETYATTLIKNSNSFNKSGHADLFNSSNIQISVTDSNDGQGGTNPLNHKRGFQQVLETREDGFSMTINKTIEEILYATDTNIGIQNLNNNFKVVNSQMNFGLMQKFASTMSFDNKGLTTSSFSKKLFVLIAMAEQLGNNYFGGLEKTYWCSDGYCPRVTSALANVTNIFPLTTNAVGGNLTAYITTAAKIAQQGTKWSRSSREIYIRKEDANDVNVNNVWVAMHLEHPMVDRRVNLATSNDVNHTPISNAQSETYSNATYIKGEKSCFTIIIADEWDSQIDYVVSIGGAAISTITHSPYGNVAQNVPVLNIGLITAVFSNLEKGYIRWLRYCGNYADIKRAKELAMLAFHKFYLIQSSMNSFHATSGSSTIYCGLDDQYHNHIPGTCAIILDDQDIDWGGNTTTLNVSLNNFAVDCCYNAMSDTDDLTWLTYFIPDELDTHSFAAAAGWLTNVGIKYVNENLYYILLETVVSVNKMALALDLWRSKECKPSTTELCGGAGMDPFYVNEQKARFKKVFEQNIYDMWELKPMDCLFIDYDVLITLTIANAIDGLKINSCISTFGVATNLIADYCDFFNDKDESSINDNRKQIGAIKYYIDYPDNTDQTLTINNYTVDTIEKNYVKRIPFQKAFSIGNVTVACSSNGTQIDTSITLAQWCALAAEGEVVGYYNYKPIMPRCHLNTKYSIMVGINELNAVMSIDTSTFCYDPQIARKNNLNINAMKLKEDPFFKKLGKSEEKTIILEKK